MMKTHPFNKRLSSGAGVANEDEGATVSSLRSSHSNSSQATISTRCHLLSSLVLYSSPNNFPTKEHNTNVELLRQVIQ